MKKCKQCGQFLISSDIQNKQETINYIKYYIDNVLPTIAGRAKFAVK